ncbi:MAG: hypothetical protein OEW69_10020, partial [Nitrospirota bacterium]|nr:hypothetical protein [Nitrospirota bacterium]
MRKKLPDEVLRKIREAIAVDFSKEDSVQRDMGMGIGRSVTINLPEPIFINNCVINAIRIKGVCFNQNEVLEPFVMWTVPREPFFDVEGGFVEDQCFDQPYKGMFYERAYNQWRINRKAFEKGMRVDYPGGFGRYYNKTFQGRMLGFTIEGMEDKSDMQLLGGLVDLIGWKEFTKRGDMKIMLHVEKTKRNKAKILHMVADSGLQLRHLHKSGIIHRFISPTNMKYRNRLISIGDFEDSIDADELTLKQKIGYRLYDLYALLLSFPQISENMFAKLTEMGIPIWPTVLEAYFVNNKEWRSIGIDNDSIHRAMMVLENEELAKEDKVIQLMRRIIEKEEEEQRRLDSDGRHAPKTSLKSLLPFALTLLLPGVLGCGGRLSVGFVILWGALLTILFFKAFPGISNWILEKLGIKESINWLRHVGLGLPSFDKLRTLLPVPSFVRLMRTMEDKAAHPPKLLGRRWAAACLPVGMATFTYSTIRMLQIFPAPYKLYPETSVVTFGVVAVILTIILYEMFPPSTKTNLILLGNNGQGVFDWGDDWGDDWGETPISDTQDFVDRGGKVSLREIWRFMRGIRGTMPYGYIEWKIAKDDIPVQITTKEHIVGKYFLNERETVKKIKSPLPPIEKCRPGQDAEIDSVQFVTKFRIGKFLRPQLVWTFKEGEVKKLARVKKLNIKLRPTGYPVITDGTYRGERLILITRRQLGCFVGKKEIIINKINKEIQRIISKKKRKKVCTLGKSENAFKVIRVVSKKGNLVWAFYERDIEKVAEYFGLTLRGEVEIPVFKKGKGVILLTRGGGLEEYYGGISCHRAERVAKLARKRFPDPKKYQAKDKSRPHEYTVEDAKEPFTLKRYRVGRCYNWGVHEGEVEACMSYLGATFIAPKITRDYIPITVPSLEIRVVEGEDVIRKRLREEDIPLARTYDKPWFDLSGVRLYKRLAGTTGMIWAVRVKDFKAFCEVVGLTPPIPIPIRPRPYRIWPSLPEGMEWSDFGLVNYEEALKKYAKLK